MFLPKVRTIYRKHLPDFIFKHRISQERHFFFLN